MTHVACRIRVLPVFAAMHHLATIPTREGRVQDVKFGDFAEVHTSVDLWYITGREGL